jgi:hypothetical protein
MIRLRWWCKSAMKWPVATVSSPPVGSVSSARSSTADADLAAEQAHSALVSLEAVRVEHIEEKF